MTYWKVVSFETKLSERKYPLGSENSVIMFQNASSLNSAGRNSVATSGLDVKLRGPKKAMSAVALARRIRRRIGSITFCLQCYRPFSPECQFLAIFVTLPPMQNWLSASGIVVFIVVAWVISEDRKSFPWRVVIWGLLLQFVFGFLVLYWEPGTRFFLKLNDVFNALLNFSKQGAQFVFGALGSTDTGDTPVSLKEYLTRLGAESRDPVIQTAIRTGTVPGIFFAFQVLVT